jgi:hypothetical protein
VIVNFVPIDVLLIEMRSRNVATNIYNNLLPLLNQLKVLCTYTMSFFFFSIIQYLSERIVRIFFVFNYGLSHKQCLGIAVNVSYKNICVASIKVTVCIPVNLSFSK